MGIYATTTSLSVLLPNALKHNTTTADSETVLIFSKQIDKAEAMVNAAVSRWYSLPFTANSIPPVVRSITEDIALFYLIRSVYTNDGGMRQDYLDDYKDALALLKKLETGSMYLVDTAGSIITRNTSNFIKSNTDGYTPIFDVGTATGWDVDSDQLHDIDSSKK